MARKKLERWKTIEHERAINSHREMIKNCSFHRYELPNRGCDKCLEFENKSCPSRRYLATCNQPDAWEVKP